MDNVGLVRGDKLEDVDAMAAAAMIFAVREFGPLMGLPPKPEGPALRPAAGFSVFILPAGAEIME